MIKVHPQHGLAPALTFCRICGSDVNEIALLGSNADKVMQQVQEAMGKPKTGYKGLSTERIPSDSLCDTCMSHLNNRGTIIIAGDTHEYLRLSGEQVDCMLYRVADAKGRVLDFDAMRGKVINIPKAFWFVDNENIRLRNPEEWTT